MTPSHTPDAVDDDVVGFASQEHDDDLPGERPPFWVGLSVALDVLLCLALLPLALVVIFPPFAVYAFELAKGIVWLSPILLAGNVLSLLWGFPRKRPVVTGFTGLGIVIVFVAFAVAVYAAGGKDPITVLGIPFGGE